MSAPFVLVIQGGGTNPTEQQNFPEHFSPLFPGFIIIAIIYAC